MGSPMTDNPLHPGGSPMTDSEEEELEGNNEDEPPRMLRQGIFGRSATSFTQQARSFFVHKPSPPSKETDDIHVENMAQARLKILDYQEKRARDESNWYLAFIRTCQVFVTFGLVFRALGLYVALGLVNHVDGDDVNVFYTGFGLQMLGTFILMTGVLLMTTCPVIKGEDGCVVAMSVDEAMKRNPKVWNGLCIVAVIVTSLEVFSQHASHPNTYPFAPLLSIGPALCALAGKKTVDGRLFPRPTTVTIFWLLLILFGWGVTYLYQSFVEESRQCPRYTGIAGGLRIVASIFAVLAWKKHGCLSDPDATFAAFATIYMFMVISGFSNIIEGLGSICSGEIRLATYYLVNGALWVLPTLLMLIKGRRETRLFIRRRFENKASKFDGAFIAQLLDAVPVSELSVWYVLRKSPNEQYTDDHQRYWRQGVVTEISSSGSITVSVPLDSVRDSSRGSFSLGHLPPSKLLVESTTTCHAVYDETCQFLNPDFKFPHGKIFNCLNRCKFPPQPKRLRWNF